MRSWLAATSRIGLLRPPRALLARCFQLSSTLETTARSLVDLDVPLRCADPFSPFKAAYPQVAPCWDQNKGAKARHALRAILRECTYLPDSHAREWSRKYALERFRKYSSEAWKNCDDPSSADRVERKLKQALYSARQLQRANLGDRKRLLHVLLMAYGRTGKRRRELVALYLPAAGTHPPAEIAAENDAKPRTMDEATGNKTQSATVDDLTNGLQSDRAPAITGNAHHRPKWDRFLTPQSRALVESQVKHPPPHLTRPPLRRLQPTIPKLNSWLRPMPESRVKNITKRWYADFLDRVLPPLPYREWERLRKLASGELHEVFVHRRKSLSSPRTRSALTMVVMSGKPRFSNGPSERDTQRIDRRFMQRLWAQVFAQCPTMDWNAQTKAWTVIWGQHAMYAHANSNRPGHDIRHTQVYHNDDYPMYLNEEGDSELSDDKINRFSNVTER